MDEPRRCGEEACNQGKKDDVGYYVHGLFLIERGVDLDSLSMSALRSRKASKVPI